MKVDLSKNVINSFNTQLDDIEKNKELYSSKELGFLKTNLSIIQDVCRQHLENFTFLFPEEEGVDDEDEEAAKRKNEMLGTLSLFLKFFKRIEVLNETEDIPAVFGTCFHNSAEFAISVISCNVGEAGKSLSKCSMLARTVNGLTIYLRKLKVYEPVFSKYIKLYVRYCNLFSAFYEKEVIPFMVEENKKHKHEGTTPLEFLMLYKRSLELFDALKECGWTEAPPAIGELFVHHIVEWIWDCDKQFTAWNERIINAETWTPISEDVYYSNSIIDIIGYLSTAKEELIELRFGVAEGPSAAGKYAEEIWKAYSLVIHFHLPLYQIIYSFVFS